VSRFLRRVWNLVEERKDALNDGEGLVALRHRTIKKVGEDIESFAFNTAISALMIYLNAVQDEKQSSRADLQHLLLLLNPFAPHLTEELWEKLGHHDSLCRSPWPAYDPKHLVDSTVEYAVQVNGKVRDTFTIAADASQDQVAETALKLDKVKTAIGSLTIVKRIVVPKKLVNLVVK
jgi:leucyl-tRNA synthetase